MRDRSQSVRGISASRENEKKEDEKGAALSPPSPLTREKERKDSCVRAQSTRVRVSVEQRPVSRNIVSTSCVQDSAGAGFN